MKIHKEGHRIIAVSAAVFAVMALSAVLFMREIPAVATSVALLLLLLFIIRFFRIPERAAVIDEGAVFAPADGCVVVIEPTEEHDYLGDMRIQVSVFMSIWNAHVNWFPIGGRIEHFMYHPGRFMVAWHPKSSEENERTTIVVNTGREKILFRQIAGILARRIVTYAKVGETAVQNSQCGIIKFGSRVDIFLPPDAEICVELGQKVTGTQTVIARLKR